MRWRTDASGRRGYNKVVPAIDPRRHPTRPVRSLQDAHDRIGPAAPGVAIAELRRAPSRATAAARPPPRPAGHDVAIADWELLFDAAMARLHGLVDGITAAAPARRQASPASTGSLHDDLVDCAAALDQLHLTMTHERTLCHQRVAALFDATPGTCGSAARADTRPCLACAARLATA